MKYIKNYNKLINGNTVSSNYKLYDTATASKVGSYIEGANYGGGATYEITETLYITSAGTAFITYEGGPGDSRGNDDCSKGKGMQLVVFSEAVYWCLRNNIDVETILEHFEIEEG